MSSRQYCHPEQRNRSGVRYSMHVALPDLRALRQGGLVLRYAIFDSVAFVLVEIPDAGSAGTSIEQPSRQAQWALVIDGELTCDGDGGSLAVPAGHALHVPGGPEHRLSASGGSRIAGFLPVDPSIEISDRFLVQQGFEILAPAATGDTLPIVAPTSAQGDSPDRVITARTWSMPPYAMTVARFGRASGYTATWCDAPHWGLVTSGQLVIEYEHDVEIVTAGDVYHCPSGAPAHRLEAADPATIVDLTPFEAIEGGGRIAEWRLTALSQAVDHAHAEASVVALR
jgi:quercetin dioxygenase-like cupin family protein